MIYDVGLIDATFFLGVRIIWALLIKLFVSYNQVLFELFEEEWIYESNNFEIIFFINRLNFILIFDKF